MLFRDVRFRATPGSEASTPASVASDLTDLRQNLPTWLNTLFGASSPVPPRLLSSGIVPIIDVLDGGGVPMKAQVAAAGGVGVTTKTLLTTDAAHGAYVFAVSAVTTVLGAGAWVRLSYDLSRAVSPKVTLGTVGEVNFAGFVEFAGSASARIYVPPSTSLEALVSAGAGDTVTVDVAYWLVSAQVQR